MSHDELTIEVAISGSGVRIHITASGRHGSGLDDLTKLAARAILQYERQRGEQFGVNAPMPTVQTKPEARDEI
jgi:hypothetical protein